jgi:hypothetical protein
MLRTLKFAQHLGRFGWQPTVLTVDPMAYEQRYETIPEPPAGVEVHRVRAFDTARHLSILGRYPRFLAVPDRWATWRFAAVRRALSLIRRLQPQVIWSTYPIATAHVIGASVHRRTGLPWVADCRDSMTEADYPRDPEIRDAFLRIEREMVQQATRVVFTAPGTQRMYAERYPEVPAGRWQLMPNGYDEEDFTGLPERQQTARQQVTLLHSGVLYPIERNPRALFSALRSLRDRGAMTADSLRVVLRACGHEREIGALIEEFGIADLVRLEPGLPYRDALAEMTSVDALLLLQAANCNHQIPAKLYEYLRAGRPLLALTDPAGDTARQVVAASAGAVIPLDDAVAIERELPRFLDQVRAGTLPVADRAQVRAFDRIEQSRRLAGLFDQVLVERGRRR